MLSRFVLILPLPCPLHPPQKLHLGNSVSIPWLPEVWVQSEPFYEPVVHSHANKGPLFPEPKWVAAEWGYKCSSVVGMLHGDPSVKRVISSWCTHLCEIHTIPAWNTYPFMHEKHTHLYRKHILHEIYTHPSCNARSFIQETHTHTCSKYTPIYVGNSHWCMQEIHTHPCKK